MALTLKEGADTVGLPTIRLAGNDYYVAPLLLRQIIANVTLAGKVFPALRKYATLLKAVAADKPTEALPDIAIDEADLLALVDYVRNGLVRLYPGVCREDILDQPVTILQLMMACDVVSSQSGGVKDTDAGETLATSDSKPSIGASSSPTS